METNLALVAAERVRDGILTTWTELRTFGGCGSGTACAMCGSAIPRNEMEIEVEYVTNRGIETVVMHVECDAVWRGAIRDKAHGSEPARERI